MVVSRCQTPKLSQLPPTSSTAKLDADASVSEEPIDTMVNESSDGDVDLQAISPKNKGGTHEFAIHCKKIK